MRARHFALLALFALLLPDSVLAQCEGWIRGPIDDGLAPNGTDGAVLATVTWDPDGTGPLPERLVIGGNFAEVAGVPAQNVAQYDPTTGQWSAFGVGISATVNALVVYQGEVVVGTSGDDNPGTFDHTVRRWDGSQWQNMSATNTGSVYALHVSASRLYAGGNFQTNFVVSPLPPAYGLARWNGAIGAWEPLPLSGFHAEESAQVRAIETLNGVLYFGGYANHPTQPGSRPVLTRLYLEEWIEITNDTDRGAIFALGNFAGELLVGGGFSELLGTTGLNSIAGWNGTAMHGFHTGVSSTPPNGNRVRSIWLRNGIVIAGDFENASGIPANNVAFWPAGGSSWQPLTTGTDGEVYTLDTFQDQLVAGGQFQNTSVPSAHLARWNGLAWSTFGGSTSDWVFSYVPYRGRLVAGGSFVQQTSSLNTAFNIAGWNGGSLSNFSTGMNDDVFALESFKYPGVSGDYELIAGGAFSVAGGGNASRIARWREDPISAFPPPAWEPMGAGFNNNVLSIERASGVTYAAGLFTASSSTVLNYVARWNETTDQWESMGGGMNGYVGALKEFGGALYAGGGFTTAGGVATGGLARWNGTSWSMVGGTFSGTVYSLEVHDGMLYIGGLFPGLPNGSNIARYDGFSYSNVGSGGASGAVTDLLSAGGRLYAGGNFTAIGGVSANHVGYWDGSAWTDMAGGTTGIVSALGRWGNETHVGGNFTGVYGGPPVTPHWARWSETGLPFFTLQPYPLSQVGTLGGAATFSSSLAGGFESTLFQWYHDDVPLVDGLQSNGATIVGAHAPVLTISALVPSFVGSYRVEASNGCGAVSSSNAILDFDPTAVPGGESTVFFGLGPNPTVGRTNLAFGLEREARVQFTVHDQRGRRVRVVDLGRLSAGRHEAHWDLRDGAGGRVAAGVYFVSLERDGGRVAARRVTVLR